MANRILIWLAITAFGAMAGHAFINVAYDAMIPDLRRTWPGVRGGLFIMGASSAFEIFAMSGRFGTWLRRLPFLILLFTRACIHTVIIMGGLFLNYMLSKILVGQTELSPYKSAEFMQESLFAFAVLGLLLFVLQMRTLIGGRTLMNLVLGRYHRPVREERLFLLIDLVGSTSLAARFGDERFHSYISAFLFDIDAPIVEAGGEVHSYIGDAMIATWPLSDGRNNARAINAIFAARERLAHREAWYREKFDEGPRFRAVLHGGPIVACECGDSHRQITYLGDVLNTTARLEALSKSLGVEILASRSLLDRGALPDGIVAIDLGSHKLKGLAEPLDVRTLITSRLR